MSYPPHSLPSKPLDPSTSTSPNLHPTHSSTPRVAPLPSNSASASTSSSANPGFSRSGFAPIPHRHAEIPVIAPPSQPQGGGYPSDAVPDRRGSSEREYERDPYGRDRERDWERERDWDRAAAPGGRDPRDWERERDWERDRRYDNAPPPPAAARYDRFEREREDYDRREPWYEDERRAGPDYDAYDRPKRRRSPSPSHPSHRARHDSPPYYPANSGPSAGPFASSDPASLAYLLPFRNFAEWFRASHPQTARQDDEDFRRLRADIESGLLPESAMKEKIGMAKRYERYRREFYSRQLFAIYLTHRSSTWFIERYSQEDEITALRRRVNRSGRVPAIQQYISELRAGEWDDVDYDIKDDAKTEALDRALGEEGTGGAKVEIPPLPGQVFVKTVPPSTRRIDLEQLFAKADGFKWLALSEPFSKKGFHRVGWAQYAEGVDADKVVEIVDGQKIDTFTFHMGVNATSSIGRTRIAPSIASRVERLEADAENARELALLLEDELMAADDEGETDAAAEGNGDAVEAEQPIEDNGERRGSESEEGKEGKVVPAKKAKFAWERVSSLHERGSVAVEDTIGRLFESVDDSEEGAQAKKARIKADQWISYLRNALHTCYYCLATSSFAEELHRKCIAHARAIDDSGEDEDGDGEGEGEGENENGHGNDAGDGERNEAEQNGEEDDAAERREDRAARAEGAKSSAENGKKKYMTKSADERWLDHFESRYAALVRGDVSEVGGRDMTEETNRLTAPHIKQETTDKYRCKMCDKLFRAQEFVMKHVVTKHPELVKEKLDEVTLFNAFARDPQHLQPDKNTLAAIDDKLPTSLLPLAINPLLVDSAAVAAAAAAGAVPGHGVGAPGLAAMGIGMGMPGMAGMMGGAAGPGFNMQQQMMMMMQMSMMMGGAGGAGAAGGMGGVGVPGMGGMRMGMGMPGGAAGVTPGSGMGGGGGGSQNPRLPRRDYDAPPSSSGSGLGVDPRAARGRVSYQDLDELGASGGGGAGAGASGGDDGGLPY